MTTTVAVIGGGYGGVTVAKALDNVADVVLIEPKDTFVHNVAALRALVVPDWTDRIFLPYDRLLERGRVLRDRAVRVRANTITLASGAEVSADYLVLATGSAYPFPAKLDEPDSTVAKAMLSATHEALAGAARILLLGAGPVGLELAGEITAAWPDKVVTVVDHGEDIVSGGGLPEEFRTELRGQLKTLGVTLLLGTSLREPPPTEPGEAKTFTVATSSGETVEADIWFRCYGVVPNTTYVTDDLALARLPDGRLTVTAELRLAGYDHIFAIGDLTAIAEPKMAKAAEKHGEVVAANIGALIHGDGELLSYQPGPPGISLPLGPTGGASYAPSVGVLGAEPTSQLKGATMRVDSYRDLLNIR